MSPEREREVVHVAHYAIDYTVPALEVDLAEVRATFETNFVAIVNICKTFIPLLIKAKGTIVQIGSVAGVSILLSDVVVNHLTCLDYPVRLWLDL
jgi:short-subunit dehydrogenase